MVTRLYVQARGCDAVDADTVRRAMEFYSEQTNVAATVVLADRHQETHLAF